MRKFLAVLAMLFIITVVLRLNKPSETPESPLPKVVAPRAKLLPPTKPAGRGTVVVPDSITLDKRIGHRVLVNPFMPDAVPTAMRTSSGGWSAPETVYKTNELTIYAGLEEMTNLVEDRPSENWFQSRGFGLIVLKDYGTASAATRKLVDETLGDLNVSQEKRDRFRFVDEAVFINTEAHTYTVIGRKFVDTFGETFYTMPEGFREVSDIDARSPDVNEVTSWTASGIVHSLSDSQQTALNALRSSGFLH